MLSFGYNYMTFIFYHEKFAVVILLGCTLLIITSGQDQISSLRDDEFSNEVELLAKIEHKNLVRLLGYTDRGNERIIITEYVPNGTLREHLDGNLHFLLFILLH